MQFFIGLIVGLLLGAGGTVILFGSVILPRVRAKVRDGIQVAAAAAGKKLG